MTHYTTDKYRIDIYDDQTFTEGSADNVYQYDFVYFDKSEYDFPSVFGIKIFENDTLIKSAVIGSAGGGTAIHDKSAIVENEVIAIGTIVSFPYPLNLWNNFDFICLRIT